MESLEKYFSTFKKNIIGDEQTFDSPYGKKRILYADWTASGRLYAPIEKTLSEVFGPYVANTHTENSFTGGVMTEAYRQARSAIKNHVHADENDILILTGSGMTGAINKLQRIMGLRVPEILEDFTGIPEDAKPVVFISHMEHHSNHTSWLETIADVVIIPYDERGLIDYEALEPLMQQYAERSLKIVSVTACSNVTGIVTDYHRIARIAHRNNGICFVDFACSAPYIDIDMHPDEESHLDAVFFSPHKFLGGPGTEGVLIFNKNLYHNTKPDHPGGGTVVFTNPWGEHNYTNDIEVREDGGTPGFLQAVKTALAIRLKEQMGTENILKREEEINSIVFDALSKIKNLQILAARHTHRMGIFSFVIEDAHFNLIVKLLNDRFGIQTRGGCSCAGTYGHYLLHIDDKSSEEIKNAILEGELSARPGWVRMSIHPTMTDEEVKYICDSIKKVAQNHKDWAKDYLYIPEKNDFVHKSKPYAYKNLTSGLFKKLL